MARTRNNLIEAAKKLMWERGYEAMSPAIILEESGAGQGSLYHHFKGKKHLAITALEDISDEMRQSSREIFSDRKPPLERVKTYLLSSRDGIKGCRLGRFATETAIFEPDFCTPVARYFDDLERRLTMAFDEAKALGQLRPTLDSADLALAVVAVVQGGFLLCRIHQDATVISRATESAWRLIEATFPARAD